MSTISVKQVTLIQGRIRAMKTPQSLLSGQLSSLLVMLHQFGINKDNPLRESANQVIEDYKTLTEHVGRLSGDLKEIENEILAMDEN